VGRPDTMQEVTVLLPHSKKSIREDRQGNEKDNRGKVKE